MRVETTNYRIGRSFIATVDIRFVRRLFDRLPTFGGYREQIMVEASAVCEELGDPVNMDWTRQIYPNCAVLADIVMRACDGYFWCGNEAGIAAAMLIVDEL